MKTVFRTLLPALLPLALPLASGAQSAPNPCAMDLLQTQLRAANSDFDAQLAQNLRQLSDRVASRPDAAQKSTAATNYKVQVVFHFVLDSSQVRQLGGEAGIQTRVTSQMQQLNTDWNARNADSVKTPAAFRSLRGNMGVEFVLARRDPSGKPSSGYEIVYTTRSSYNIQGNTAGSSIAYSDAKYAASGGAAAWDPSRYYNVWVLNMLPAGVLGIATPPRRPPFDLFPEAEQGTCIFYGAFGRRSSAGEYYTYPQATMGRTLTHETGHFFNLFHVWGSDSTCNDDDGIGDTPQQATNTPNNSPAFPVLDACSNSGSGIMFMNFMDYAIDTAQSLFTKGQVAASHSDLDAGGLRASLVAAATAVEGPDWHSANMTVAPNPLSGPCSIRFDQAATGTLLLCDLAGRSLKRRVVANEAVVQLQLDGLAPGMYMLHFENDRGNFEKAIRIVKQ